MNIKMNKIIDNFPKTRPSLPEENYRIYANEYKKTRNKKKEKPLISKISSRVSNWMHLNVASRQKGGNVLELGAGTLNHLQFESDFSSYDVVEPFELLFFDNPDKNKIGTIYKDIREIADGKKYDRIISVAVLEHLTELPFAIAKSAVNLKDGGYFQAGIPSEGGFLWGLTWRMSTGLAYKKRNGISMKPLVRHEHINTATEIIEVSKYFFDDVKVKFFPLATIHTSLFCYIESNSPKIDVCNNYINSYLHSHLTAPEEETKQLRHAPTD